MFENLLLYTILCPMIAAAACMIFKTDKARKAIVMITGSTLIPVSLYLTWSGPGHSILAFTGSRVFAGAIQVADFLILGLIFYVGVKFKNRMITLLSVAQIGLLAYFEFVMMGKGHTAPVGVYADNLSLIMVCLICIAGSLIILYALPYMASHETHLKLVTSRQPRFFALLFLFLGAMNALVTINDLMLFYLFFEITTLCSFLLIGHDNTPQARKNSITALWINSLGGLALLLGIVLIYHHLHILDIQIVISQSKDMAAMLVPLGLLCVAGFTKAAQMPFQKWLLGAMVAPTPTSALLHSSTMV